MKDQFRYRLFYRLIDFCFVLNILWILEMIGEAISGSELDYGLFDPIALALAVSSLIIPGFLVFARFMHDEYITLLWQKTSQTVVRALIILPLPMLVVYGAAMGITGGELVELESGTTAKEASHRGLVTGIVWIWAITPMFVTFAFQWHRWRGV
ncbi:hypothetical protein ACFOWX_03055 [Sphingorhabdus arenilitoris]|uniref:Uncharacterized protein n=1 Tax=Sphingorhabdus arenilitoris TaxID=1490041 RepID=A0ABV8RDF7_9SPHN